MNKHGKAHASVVFCNVHRRSPKLALLHKFYWYPRRSVRWHAWTNLSPSMNCVHIWLRARQIRLSTWAEPYKSDSGQFCLSYNHIKCELKHLLSWFAITIILICMHSLRYKKFIPLFSLFDSMTFNKAMLFPSAQLCMMFNLVSNSVKNA